MAFRQRCEPSRHGDAPAMFFGSKKQRISDDGMGPTNDPRIAAAANVALPQLDTWRRSAQRARRAWNEWSAGRNRERPALYQRYLAALVEEERAAAKVQHALAEGQPSKVAAHDSMVKDAGGADAARR